jgi:protein-S-isoprenylcysteine O-methyltransferase Ste14
MRSELSDPTTINRLGLAPNRRECGDSWGGHNGGVSVLRRILGVILLIVGLVLVLVGAMAMGAAGPKDVVVLAGFLLGALGIWLMIVRLRRP